MFLFTNDAINHFSGLQGRVYFLLMNAVSKKEEIAVEKKFVLRDSDRMYIADFYLPNGCKNLNIPKKTAIEVKSQLLFDTIDRYMRISNELQAEGVDAFYLLIEEETAADLGKLSLPEWFKIVTIESLYAVILNSKAKLNQDNNNKVELGGDMVPSEKQDPKVALSIEAANKQRIKRARFASESGKSTFFLGAGVSIDAGLPSWDVLLKRILAIINKKKPDLKMRFSVIDSDAKRSSIIMARYLENAFNNNDDNKKDEVNEAFISALRTSLYQKAPKQSDLIKTISKIIKERNTESGVSSEEDGKTDSGKKWGMIDSVITYNYDDCLEEQLGQDKVYYNTITKGNRLSPGAFPVFHVHGFMPNSDTSKASDIVLTEQSYHSIYGESYHWSNIEQLHALGNTTCFFVGLSMLDPNLRRLVDQAANRDKNEAYHYAIMNQGDFEDVDLADQIFMDLGVNTIWVENYGEIPKILERIFLDHSVDGNSDN